MFKAYQSTVQTIQFWHNSWYLRYNHYYLIFSVQRLAEKSFQVSFVCFFPKLIIAGMYVIIPRYPYICEKYHVNLYLSSSHKPSSFNFLAAPPSSHSHIITNDFYTISPTSTRCHFQCVNDQPSLVMYMYSFRQITLPLRYKHLLTSLQ